MESVAKGRPLLRHRLDSGSGGGSGGQRKGRPYHKGGVGVGVLG